MDDLAHESLPIQSLSRKRKADGDDCQVQDTSSSSDPSSSCESMLIDSSATPRCPSKGSDHPSSTSWLLVDADKGMVPPWPQPSPPSSSSSMSLVAEARKEGPSRPKRPRIEIPQSISSSPRRLRRVRVYSHLALSPHRCSRRPRAGETRDTGIVSATEPGPSRGSLLRGSSLPSTPRHSYSVPVSPIEPISPHIPPHLPPINRESLKELDLEAILRNPQLRHDLLFDSGLQFRPTSSRRKRDLADNYWLAIVRELECGCTCITVDASGRPCDRICVCSSLPLPTGKPILFASDNAITVRVASRIRPLLLELLEVLVSIIQPVMSKTTGLYMQPTSLHPQFQQNVAHVALLRSILDADLIQQELDHGLFDPSGVFQSIGDIIRCHCAPMRDHAVDQMVALAKSCALGGSGSKVDAVRAIRLCFEIMELMKLDVANHQLQTLRPYLVHSASQYELKTFQESRQNGHLSLDVTREWLQSAYRELASSSKPNSILAPCNLIKYSRRTQIQIIVTRAIIELVFNPPPPSSTASSPVSSTLRTPPSVTSFPGYPETLYLDHSRLMTLSTDAADFTALYMLLMLYRQLVHSVSTTHTDGSRPNVQLDELMKLKKEIWEIGPSHLGYCFMRRCEERAEETDNPEFKKWRDEVNDVILQVAMRANEAQVRSNSFSKSPNPFASHSSPSSSSRLEVHARIPDEHMIKLASSWAESNLRQDSPLSSLMYRRIRDQVLEAAVQMAVPSLKQSDAQLEAGAQQAPGTTNGLEPLMPEINHLAERLAKLASIHLDVYGALYAQPGFLVDWSA
ncbi:hypothetical protein AcV5_007703 [Taiwanofungus camphoratus]|nr:hypothetical protein AcW2_007368 [Antrodia cinnamomea]KAI0927069.1 hypothetical protein AcV5_007703 [Antrodia cinnamomea]KAI0947322.1 hypothetical protein AcV7_009776 [Antrodia cinnamomea]